MVESSVDRTETEESEDEDDDLILNKLKKKKNIKKNAISAEAYGKYNQRGDFKARIIKKTEEENQMILSILINSFMFSSLN